MGNWLLWNYWGLECPPKMHHICGVRKIMTFSGDLSQMCWIVTGCQIVLEKSCVINVMWLLPNYSRPWVKTGLLLWKLWITWTSLVVDLRFKVHLEIVPSWTKRRKLLKACKEWNLLQFVCYCKQKKIPDFWEINAKLTDHFVQSIK